MSPHTRRSFVASAVALAGMGGGQALAQNTGGLKDPMASPVASVDPGQVLQAYVDQVWNGDDGTAIADLFDSEYFDLAEVLREHRIYRDTLRESPDPVELLTITTDSDTAIGFGIMYLANGDDYDLFILVRVTEDGKISAYRWMAQPPT